MIIGPTPAFGWNSIYKGARNFLAMANATTNAAGVVTSELGYRISEDGKHWRRAAVGGDLAAYTSSAGKGAFSASKMIAHGDKAIVVGRVWESASVSKGAIFESSEGLGFRRRVLPNPAITEIVDIASDGATILALGSGVGISYFIASHDDGVTWQNVPMTDQGGNVPQAVMKAGAYWFAIADGVRWTTDLAADSWSRHSPGFSVQELAFDGTHIYAFGNFGIVRAALSNLSSWSHVVTDTGGGFDTCRAGAGTLIAARVSQEFRRSIDGTNWPVRGNYPQKPTQSQRVWEAFKVEDEWFAYLSGGGVAVSADDGLTWAAIGDNGLIEANYPAVCHVGWDE